MLRVLKWFIRLFVREKERSYEEWVNSPDFLTSVEWARARYDILAFYEGYCSLCGRTAHEGAILQVDHIRSRRRYPQLALDRSNLQILCKTCNRGKGNRFGDWRKKVAVSITGRGRAA